MMDDLIGSRRREVVVAGGRDRRKGRRDDPYGMPQRAEKCKRIGR